MARVVVVDPNQFRVISHSVKKTDPNDARNLALYLAKDLLPEVRMKDKDASATGEPDADAGHAGETAHRAEEQGEQYPLGARHQPGQGSAVEREEAQRSAGDALRSDGADRAGGDRGADPQSEREHRGAGEDDRRRRQKLEGHKNLTSIKGIGPLTGSILLSVIGDINDFADEGKLAAYFGIVPRVSELQRDRALRAGSPNAAASWAARRWCNAALIAQRYSPYLKRYYDKIKARRGTGKAIIALARKLLGIIYRTLKNNWVFEDFPNFVLAEAA